MPILPAGHETMTDVHMHLIPGVDDGAADMTMALNMMLRARDQGITAVFATPHSSAFDWAPGQVLEAFGLLRKAAAVHFPQMALYLGCEVYCNAGYMDGVLENLASGRYPTMNGTNYVLMEFPVRITPEKARVCASGMAQAGWIPVIAHMERYPNLCGNMELADELRAMGCRIQINAYSLREETNPDIRSWARRLAAEQKADFLGTDAHRTYHRPPCAAGGLEWLYENCPKAYADALTRGNASALLMA